uniref:Si:dkey-90a13.10 n=1 Tax=Cyprinus carpio TaxID=7962 RepID=A0A8C0Y6W3_CYPCA
MAFFGITCLGYQNPFGDRMLSSQNQLTRGNVKVALFTLNTSNTHILDLLLLRVHVIMLGQNSLLTSDISVRSCVSPSAPKQLYRVPVTDNQQYGWWVSTDGLKNREPWTQTRRFPRKNSEMTKYEAMQAYVCLSTDNSCVML